jgi:hypothetical protein
VIEYRPGIDWMVGRMRELGDRWKPVGWGMDLVGPLRMMQTDFADAGFKLPEGDPERGPVGRAERARLRRRVRVRRRRGPGRLAVARGPRVPERRYKLARTGRSVTPGRSTARPATARR